jgi:hypothetical protein
VQQLVSLGEAGVTVMAYQDEVGCVRDEYPAHQSTAAFHALSAAHTSAHVLSPKAPALWVNVESFMWQDWPNNASSTLIPAAFPRIAAQIYGVTPAHVERVIITFTFESLYEPADSPQPWGPFAGAQGAHGIHTGVSD